MSRIHSQSTDLHLLFESPSLLPVHTNCRHHTRFTDHHTKRLNRCQIHVKESPDQLTQCLLSKTNLTEPPAYPVGQRSKTGATSIHTGGKPRELELLQTDTSNMHVIARLHIHT